MIETINAAAPDLATPRRFLRYAGRDLRRALPAGMELFTTRLRAQSRQSWLGRTWLLLPTIGIVLTCIFIQRRAIVAIGATHIPYPVFVLCGLSAWQIFTDAVMAPVRRLDETKRLLTHTDVPHEAAFVAAALDAGFGASIRLAAALPFALLLGAVPGWGILLAPLAVAGLLVFGLAVGVATAPAVLLYSDARHGLVLGLTLWMFLTPVFYPIAAAGLLGLNPVRPLVEAFRASLAGESVPAAFFAILAASAALLVLAWLFYRLARPFIVERLD